MTMPETPVPRNADRINAALNHLTQGFAAFSVWSTLPNGVCKCVKGVDCTSPGKHPIPKDGFNAASVDPERVSTMLKAGSDPNYGIVWPLGDIIVVIIDVDGADWVQRLKELSVTRGKLPATKTTRTPSGGLHLFYIWPPGVPVPEGNTLHGFVTRFPMKGYVVGPGSAINGKVYAAVGPEEMAVLPLAWARGDEPAQKPLITVTDEPSAYEMPDRVETGHRHDEIVKLVASLWNKRVSKALIWVAAAELAKRFVEPMDDQRLKHEVKVAYETAEKKWVTPEGGTREVAVETESGVVIDPLAIESRIERPEPLDLGKVALPGALTGLIQHLIPITDAPLSSLALVAMVELGALMGPHPTLLWRGTQRTILFGCLVGDSHYGRKGQAMNAVFDTLAQCDPMLSVIREPYVPASGVSFIDALSDAKGEPLLFTSTELGGVLSVAKRESETLSYVMREAWDGGSIGTRNRKNGRVRASDYHLGIMAATNPFDLAKELTDTDLRNGWANRWLWFWAEKRAGGFAQTAANVVPTDLATDVANGIEFARRLGGSSVLIRPAFTMRLSPDASDMLDDVMRTLDFPAHGTVGVLRQRMPPIAVRLAMVAACLDLSAQIEVEHLEFGFAMTEYAVQSIRAVFGTRVSDYVAMNILHLFPQSPDGWLNTSTIAKATAKSGDRVNRALGILLDAGLIEREDRKTAGRTAIGYRLRTY